MASKVRPLRMARTEWQRSTYFTHAWIPGGGVTADASAHALLARIAEVVHAHTPIVAGRDEPYFEAAVAVILRTTSAGIVEILFITRATRENDPWSGQIGLPGGRHDPTDDSLEATAVRETLEEVSLDLRRDGAIIGALDELRPRTPVLPPVIVCPFVATVSAEAHTNPSDEVADLFWAPFETIVDPTSTRDAEILVRGMRMRRPAIHYQGRVIWGMTERILHNLAKLIG
jgi:8-oxo-dGTP pyrophosphatase MutT (NUDIX family)